MSYELIYTSAPETFDGAGYGAVGKSANFPERLEKFIRQYLNQYDFPLGDSAAAAQPAVFSHVRFDDQHQQWQILSRIGSGGYDYTQRAVFFAHHVALTPDELGNNAVADFMLDPTFFKTQWDKKVGLIPPRTLQIGKNSAGNLGNWSSLAGDSDWAKIWIHRWMENKQLPEFLIAPNLAAPLNLFAEALTLLPIDVARGVNFLSALGAERSGIHFDWVGLLSAHSIAQLVSKRFSERVLDLSRPLGRVPASQRSRLQPAPRPVPREKVATPIAAAATSAQHQPDPWDQQFDDEPNHASGRGAGKHKVKAIAPPPPPPPPPPTMRNKTGILVGAAVASICILLGGGYWALQGPRPQPVQPPAPSVPETKIETKLTSSPKSGPVFRPVDKPPTISTAAPTKIRIVHIGAGLRKRLQEASDTDTEVKLDEQVFSDGQMRLIVPKMLATEFKATNSADGNEITINLQNHEIVRLRLVDSQLRWKWITSDPKKWMDTVAEKIRLCVLEISPNGRHGDRTPIHILFTPTITDFAAIAHDSDISDSFRAIKLRKDIKYRLNPPIAPPFSNEELDDWKVWASQLWENPALTIISGTQPSLSIVNCLVKQHTPMRSTGTTVNFQDLQRKLRQHLIGISGSVVMTIDETTSPTDIDLLPFGSDESLKPNVEE